MNVPSWESLIAERMRPAETTPKLTDPVKERKRLYNIKRYYRLKSDPEFIRKRKERAKAYRSTDEYREHHKIEMRLFRKRKKHYEQSSK